MRLMKSGRLCKIKNQSATLKGASLTSYGGEREKKIERFVSLFV